MKFQFSLIMVSFLLLISASGDTLAQADSCFQATPFCSITGVDYVSTTTAVMSESGPDYGCLMTQPNPEWFYLEIGNSGDLTLTLTNNGCGGNGCDINFVCWGPFANPVSPCTAQLDTAALVDCSYSTAVSEVVTIPNAQTGDFYLLMVSNFDNQPTTVSMNQTGGTGSTVVDTVAFSVSNDTIIYAGDSATICVTPEDPSYAYLWSNGVTTACQTVTPGITTTYSVTVNTGCFTYTDEVTVGIYADSDSCAVARCISSAIQYGAGTNNGTAEPGPDYGCLLTQPNPAWFYMEIDNPGNLEITMSNSNNEDIDFIIWGPFNDPTSPCTAQLDSTAIVDCSYSTTATEVALIAPASTGEIYLMLIINFSNNPTLISVDQTGGTASIICDSILSVPPTMQQLWWGVYPNPTSSNFTVEFDLTERATVGIAIHDLLGQRITGLKEQELNAGHYQEIMPMHDLPDGIYLLTVTINGTPHTKKVVKVRER